jgi:phage terminase small subunit
VQEWLSALSREAARVSLTPRQLRFVEEYLLDLNATAAARRAGYSPKTAEVQGSRLLRNVKVQSEIQQLQCERSERTKISVDRVLTELAAIAFSDIRDVTCGHDGLLITPSPAAAKAVAAFSWSRDQRENGSTTTFAVRLWDKTYALDMCLKHLGLYRLRPDLETILTVLGPLGDQLRAHILARATGKKDGSVGA